MERKSTSKKTVAYIRCSHASQVVIGSTLPAQKERIEAYAKLYGLEIVSIETDAGLSAKSLERPGLQRALSALKEGRADCLLVVKLDRLTRSVASLGELLEDYFTDGKYKLCSIEENIDTRTASGILILNILASVAQWERQACSDRIKFVMSHLKQNGKVYCGKLPYGFRATATGKLIKDEREQEVIATARKLKNDYELSAHAVARQLTKMKIYNRKNNPFASAQIIRMLSDT